MRKLSILIVLLFAFSDANSQWIQTNGLEGIPRVVCFSSNPKSIFTGISTGIYRTTNNGLRWELCCNGLNNYDICSIASKGDTVFTGTSQGLYISTNNGMNWSLQYFQGAAITQILINNNRTFVWKYDELYYSDDYGQTWFGSGIPGAAVCTYAVDNILFFGTSGSGIFKSTNNGVSWTQVNNGLNSLSVSQFTSNEGVLFAGIMGNPNGYVYRTTNYGDNWVQTGPGITCNNVTCLSSDGTALYAGTGDGLFISTNNGANWFRRDNGITNTWIGKIISKSNITFAAPDFYYGGLFSTTNQGYNWSASTSGFSNLYITSLTRADNYLFASSSNSGLYRSSDDGNTWLQISFYITKDVKIVRFINNKLYVGHSNSSGNCIYYSVDMGDNWIPLGLTGKIVTDLVFKDTIMFVGTTTGVYKSTDGGINFIPTGLISNAYVNKMMVKENLLFVACIEGIYLSSNNGTVWAQSSPRTTYDLIILNNDIYAATYNKVYKSTNNGNSWFVTNFFGDRTNGLLVINNTLIALATIGVVATNDGGQYWKTYNEGLSFLDSKCMIVKDEYAFLGTNGASVYKRPVNQIVYVKNLSSTIPGQYSLSQNYPNPFNPATKIKFDVPEDGVVMIKVYNILGKEVATLVNERLQPGTYETTFDGSNLNSGIYFYKLSINNKQLAIRKMVLLK